jgi:hypothetical protein
MNFGIKKKKKKPKTTQPAHIGAQNPLTLKSQRAPWLASPAAAAHLSLSLTSLSIPHFYSLPYPLLSLLPASLP